MNVPTSALPDVIFIELNELNFDLVRCYVNKGMLPAFGALIKDFQLKITSSEQEYQHLEPWIQWVSVHTGKTFLEHRIFRLGEITSRDHDQIFEILEREGIRVGALCPMNATNKLNTPAYFVPDPWTGTKSDPDPFSKRLAKMLAQTVNDNADGRISAWSVATLFESVVRTFDVVRTARLLQMIASTRQRPWMKALVLDYLLHLIHLYLMKNKRPGFSSVFFNGGAHIQHHYLFNCEFVCRSTRNPEWYCPRGRDPILDMLQVYDQVLADYLQMADNGMRLVVATGLTQEPYDRIKFYYRLTDHAAFLDILGVAHKEVRPLMSRDFEIICSSELEARRAGETLKAIVLERDGKQIFREIEIRGARVFATLTYADQIFDSDNIVLNGRVFKNFRQHVAFVAVKNGMHAEKGYAYFSPNIKLPPEEAKQHVATLFNDLLGVAIQAQSRKSTNLHMARK